MAVMVRALESAQSPGRAMCSRRRRPCARLSHLILAGTLVLASPALADRPALDYSIHAIPKFLFQQQEGFVFQAGGALALVLDCQRDGAVLQSDVEMSAKTTKASVGLGAQFHVARSTRPLAALLALSYDKTEGTFFDVRTPSGPLSATSLANTLDLGPRLVAEVASFVPVSLAGGYAELVPQRFVVDNPSAIDGTIRPSVTTEQRAPFLATTIGVDLRRSCPDGSLTCPPAERTINRWAGLRYEIHTARYAWSVSPYTKLRAFGEHFVSIEQHVTLATSVQYVRLYDAPSPLVWPDLGGRNGLVAYPRHAFRGTEGLYERAELIVPVASIAPAGPAWGRSVDSATSVIFQVAAFAESGVLRSDRSRSLLDQSSSLGGSLQVLFEQDGQDWVLSATVAKAPELPPAALVWLSSRSPGWGGDAWR